MRPALCKRTRVRGECKRLASAPARHPLSDGTAAAPSLHIIQAGAFAVFTDAGTTSALGLRL